MTNCSAIGSFARLAVQGGSTPRVFSALSERHAFISEDLKPATTWSGGERGIGEIGASRSGRRVLLSAHVGNISFEGTWFEARAWIRRALWSPSAASPMGVSLDPSSHEFDILLDRENGIFHYQNCLVNGLTIFSKTQSLCYIVANIVAAGCSQSTPWPNPEPTLLSGPQHSPFSHYDTSFSISSIDIPLERSSLSIRNNLMPVANASVTPQKFRSFGRDIIYSGIGAFTQQTLSELESAFETPADATLSISAASIGSIVFSIQNMQNIGQTHPNVEGQSHVPIAFELKAGKDDFSTPEVSVAIT